MDPIQSLAFSIQSNPGVYAVLLGSGVSRAASIPTGWEITLDLIGKLARIRNEEAPDPESWYRATYDREPDYSDILESVAKSPAERQQLLRSYFEPDENERADGGKQPTVAHRSIAWLAARGYIRVILTTNFDRLMENALQNEGIAPAVLSTPDQIRGALPLAHTKCCVVKIHGDYLDTRIRNTSAELGRYDEAFETLLDRIFDEYGLIVCGWSAEWDAGLRAAIYRAPSRRFTTYWALHGAAGGEARKLIEHRKAETIPIRSADDFFQTVKEHVQSIDEYRHPHPLSTTVAVATLKRYLSEPRYRIRLSDFIDDSVDRVLEKITDDDFPVSTVSKIDGPAITARLRKYESTCSVMLTLASVGGYWADRDHLHIWRRALVRLAKRKVDSGHAVWLSLQRYPATLLFYALGIGALAHDNFDFVSGLFSTVVDHRHGKDQKAVETLPPSFLFDFRGSEFMKLLDGMKDRLFPLSDWLHDALQGVTKSVVSEDEQSTYLFDMLDILIALNYTLQDCGSERLYQQLPSGAYCYRTDNRKRIVEEIINSLQTMSNKSPFVTSGIFGESVEKCQHIVSVFGDHLNKIFRMII